MITYRDECVDCGLPCIGNSCRYKNVPVYICDKCGDEADLYTYDDDDRELCFDCLWDELTEDEREEITEKAKKVSA